MAHHEFDTLVAQLHRIRSRRQGLRLILTTVAAAVAGVVPQAAVACKRRGQPCEQSNQCCSRACGNKKRGKNKNKKKNGKDPAVGRCNCSLTGVRCTLAGDCCVDGDFCVSNGCAPHPVCCARQFFPCLTDCDCCGDNVCRNGICGPLGGPPDGGDECSETGEACTTTDDCCFEEDICDANGCGPGTVCCGVAGAECDPAQQGCDCCSQLECGSVAPQCESDGESQCCVPAGGQCADTCDCCAPLQCDPLSGQCVNPTCLPTQAACLPGGSGQVATNGEALDCCEPYICSTVVCDGRTIPAACCFPSGYGPCTDDCDCCGTLRCLANACEPAT